MAKGLNPLKWLSAAKRRKPGRPAPAALQAADKVLPPQFVVTLDVATFLKRDAGKGRPGKS